jgi:NAD(P)-dependent dehydrogenase (short-subunit alcohol dehydrogenase family)
MDPRSTSAVVTGAARGIGRAIATELVARGYAVVVTDLSVDDARRTADEIGAAVGLSLDVRDPAAHRSVADAAASFGPLAVWVNNAGVGYDGALVDLTDEQARALVEVNLLGPVWGSRAALAAFGSGGGDILNIASLSGLGPVPGLSLYAATKAAVVSLTQSVALEAPTGVRVHALCPDGVDTAMVDAMPEDSRAKQLVASGGGMLTPEEVAEAAVGLLGSARTVRTLPAWRGALLRTSTLAPRVIRLVEPLVRAQGRRALRRRAASR